MEKFIIELQHQSEMVENLVEKIEIDKNEIEEAKAYLPLLSQTIEKIFDIMQNSEYSLEISTDFVLQVLNDILYGIEQEDSVWLADVLRYGLIEIYYYIIAELQREE